MYGDMNEPLQVDLFAASLRADMTDLKAFMEALATKLEGAMPMQTSVTRQSGLFSREHPVREINVVFGDYQYRISRERQGQLMAQRAKVVRGIVIKTEPVPVEQWIDDLAQLLAQEASKSAQARAALERFLL